MTLIDNFSKIKSLMLFDNPGDDFYRIKILKRNKENPGMSRIIKTIDVFYVDSLEDFEKIENQIKKSCKENNARAYFDVNKKSRKKVAFKMISYVASQIEQENYKSLQSAYDSCISKIHAQKDKKWIVDVDKEDLPIFDSIMKTIEEILKLNKQKDYKIIDVIPTVSGKHIISNPFNLQLFKEKFPNIDVHKNNPTLLYYEHANRKNI